MISHCSRLIRLIVAHFAPRHIRRPRVFLPRRKLDRSSLSKLGIPQWTSIALPEVVIHDLERDWLFLMDAVRGKHPTDELRREQLTAHFSGSGISGVSPRRLTFSGPNGGTTAPQSAIFPGLPCSPSRLLHLIPAPRRHFRFSISDFTHNGTGTRSEPPWQAIKEWIPDDEPDLDWFNRPRSPNEPDPDWFDQTPTWKAPEIQLDDGRILVLEYT